MEKILNVNIESFTPLVSPEMLINQLPLSKRAQETVLESRKIIRDILSKKDKRLMVITGPCSIHDEAAVLEYAGRLKDLKRKVESKIYLLMRVYFEKPRTSTGWKGMINDPWLNGSCDIVTGLNKARDLLLKITEDGIPTATEMLDPITPQYIGDLISWSAIGARTTESQTHREMVSGLSMPVGFKNGTDGDLMVAINGIMASNTPQQFIGIDSKGRTSIVKTTGNPWTHLVVRGGNSPNYDSVSIQEAMMLLRKNGLNETIMVDCSHANSGKDYRMQSKVWQDVVNQRIDGNEAIIGLMLESHLFEGRQVNIGDPLSLRYGVSITDACISWETTEKMIVSTYYHLKKSSDMSMAYRYIC